MTLLNESPESRSDLGGDYALDGAYEASVYAGSSRTHLLEAVNSFDYNVTKRILDVVLGLMIAIVLLPVGAIIACLVTLTSPGPIFFSHRRIGRGGAFFSMWKFRTMCVNSAEVLERHLASHPEIREEWNRSHKLQNDPRVTPLGRFLRRSSLDELPQVWNVLTGRMSLVGPRPIVAAEVEKYHANFAYYVAAQPGITGLWQCSGRSSLSYDQRVMLDRQYVEEWSLWLDIKILAKTVVSVVRSKGAV
ncbi:MAG: sugar transferase [Acidobacteria bacterium]|nr:sugar transferase [Acidobacteriota bacterium]